MPASGSMLRRLAWRKAQRSVGNGACVEVATVAGNILIRYSKESGIGTFTCTPVEWRAFADSVRRRNLPSSAENSSFTSEGRRILAKPSRLSALWNMIPYRPRDRYGPSNAIDAIDRHISRSTETDDYQRRYFDMIQKISGMV